MNRRGGANGGGGGVGIGSASIVLVFSVLCLTVFTLITSVVARNSKALVDSEARLVTGYYEADILAGRVMNEVFKPGFLNELFDSGVLLTSVRVDESDVSIEGYYDFATGENTVEYYCPIYLSNDSSGERVLSDKELLVRLAVDESSYRILTWRMWDESEWAPDLTVDLFEPGDLGFFGLDQEYDDDYSYEDG